MNLKQRLFGIVLLAGVSIPVGMCLSLILEKPLLLSYLIGFGILGVLVICIKAIDPIVDFYNSLAD